MLFEEENSTWSPISPPNVDKCIGGIARNSCRIDYDEHVKKDAIAGIRMVLSLLSIGGSLSIIFSALYRRTFRKPKVFPIFTLAIADFLLACTWLVGGSMWFADVSNRVWCLAPSLLSVIFVCVSANITLAYAWSAYDNLKGKSFHTILANTGSDRSAWHPLKSLVVYSTAWLLPVVVIMLTFATLEGSLTLVHKIHNCSCWCTPYFGNILPGAYEHDEATAKFVENMRFLVAFYGYMVGTNYLVVFVLLVIIYWKILQRIRVLRRQSQVHRSRTQYGAVEQLLMKSEAQARKRVVYFLAVFTVTGFANLFLGYTFGIFETVRIHRADWHLTGKDRLPAFPMVLFILQSITVPLQGFLNALVYGWTREEFIHTIMHRRDTSGSHVSDEGSATRSGSYRSSILTSKGLSVNQSKGFSVSRSYRSLNSTSGKFK